MTYIHIDGPVRDYNRLYRMCESCSQYGEDKAWVYTEVRDDCITVRSSVSSGFVQLIRDEYNDVLARLAGVPLTIRTNGNGDSLWFSVNRKIEFDGEVSTDDEEELLQLRVRDPIEGRTESKLAKLFQIRYKLSCIVEDPAFNRYNTFSGVAEEAQNLVKSLDSLLEELNYDK